MKISIHGRSRGRLAAQVIALWLACSALPFLMISHGLPTRLDSDARALFSAVLGFFLTAGLLALARLGILRNQVEGLRAMQRGDFAEGVRRLERSVHFWERSLWLDRHRWILIGSASEMPNLLTSLNNLGLCLVFEDRLDEAVAAFHRALESYPESPLLHGNLSYLLTMSGRAMALLDTYRRLGELHPNSPTCLIQLANVLARVGQFAESNSTLERLLAADKGSFTAVLGQKLIGSRVTDASGA